MIRISEILEFLKREDVSFTFSGDPDNMVEGFSSLTHYKPGSFTWIKTQKNIPEGFDLSRLALVFVSEEVDAGSAPNAIRTAESKRAFFSTMEHFYAKEEEEERPAIGQFTYLSPKVKLGENVRIGHNCTLDGDITIGDDTVIWNNVVIIGRVRIGRRCELQSGVVIGHRSLAYTEDEAHNKTMARQFGGVTIGDRVHIAKGAWVDRGAIDDTVIEDGVIIDGSSSVGHNCVVKKNAVLVAHTALCGSVQVGEGAYLSGCTVKNQCKIGEGAFVGMGSLVLRDVRANAEVSGFPAREFLPRKNI